MHVGEGQRHDQAMIAPRGLEEEALVNMIRGVEAYAALLSKNRGNIDDGRHEILNHALGEIIESISDLSDGPRGRLDGDRLREKLGTIAGRELQKHARAEAGSPRSAQAHLTLLQKTGA
jgi:hypothetical protein